MTGSPGSRRPAGGAPGSKQLRRSWPGSPTAQESRQAGHRGRRLRAGRRDDDAPEAGLTGTLFQRQLTTARAPPEAGLTDGRRIGSRAAPRLPRGRRADGRRDRHDRHDRTPSRPSPATEASPFSRRRGRQAVFRRIPPALGPLLPWVPSVEWIEQGEDFREPSSSPRPRAPRPGPEGGALTCPPCSTPAAPPPPWWRWP